MTLRCMIVDDSPAFVEEARSLLEGQGMTVLAAAANGADAVRLAAEQHPDVVLVDIDLGQESGLEVTRSLARLADPRPPPVILISTYAQEDFAELVAESPAVGFISKSALSVPAIRRLLDEHDADGPPGPITASPGR